MKLQGRCSEIFLAFKIRKIEREEHFDEQTTNVDSQLLVFSLDKKGN